MTETPKDAEREMDALIAERVMGWPWERFPDDDYSLMRVPGTNWCAAERVGSALRPTDFLPGFSTDMAAAWTVVEKLTGFPVWRVSLLAESHGTFNCEVWAMEEDGTWACRAEEDDCDTAPLAICRAALSAVEAGR